MANVKNYGLVGVNRSLQLGKQGPKILGNDYPDILYSQQKMEQH